MKKVLILALVSIVSLSMVNATEITKPLKQQPQQNVNMKMQREKAFEKRLGLTDDQKVKAREIRAKGHEKLKPVKEEINANNIVIITTNNLRLFPILNLFIIRKKHLVNQFLLMI